MQSFYAKLMYVNAQCLETPHQSAFELPAAIARPNEQENFNNQNV